MKDVNPYHRKCKIRYAARNNAEAYAYGLDFRINGSLFKVLSHGLVLDI